MQRRPFLQTATMAVGGAIAAGCRPSDPPELQVQSGQDSAALLPSGLEARFGPVGIQLYTLRTLMADDVGATLQQVATIGYDEVEFAGYFDTPPAALRSMLDGVGLAAPSAHVDLEVLEGDKAEATIEAAAKVGHRYLVVAWLAESRRGSLDAYRRHAETFNRLGERCRQAGMTFGYHNHAFEFEALEGGQPYEVLMDETDPELVALELDFYGARAGGADPRRLLLEHPGRFQLSHIKDMGADGSMVDVGDGMMDFGHLLGTGAESGMKHFFVEHDTPRDPLATAARSYAHLVNLEVRR